MSTVETNYQLILLLQKDIIRLTTRVTELEYQLTKKAATSDLTISNQNYETKFNLIADALIRMEEKLKYISLPEDTRYFLKETEIAKLREAVNENNVVLAEMQKATRTLVATLARFDLTH